MPKPNLGVRICAVSFILVAAISFLPAAVEGAPPKGGSLKIISVTGDVRSLGPSSEARIIWQLWYAQPAIETLLKFNDQGLPAPHLAESWKIANDQKSITFSLRKGVKFHDGTDFDAEAVKFNLDAFLKGGRMDLEGISSIDVLDKHTVRLNLNPFSNVLLTNLAHLAGMISSPTALKKMGLEEFGRNPVGTGPFKFKSWRRDLSIKYERFDDYWQKGKPYVDEIEFLHIKDPMTAVASFMAGDGHAIYGVPAQQAVEWRKKGLYNIRTPRQSHSVATVGDSANPDSPFANLKVRQAVGHAIDGKAINEGILLGFNDLTNQFSGPKSWAYNKGTQGYAYDPAKSKKLLAEAGYPQGFKTTLWWINVRSEPAVAAGIQAYLKDVGIQAEVKLLEMSSWVDLCRKGWKNGLVVFACAQTVPDDLRNMMYFIEKYKFWKSMDSPKEINDLIFKALRAPDFKTKAAMTQEINQLLADKYCLVNFMMITNGICAVKKEVHDSGLFEIALTQFNPADVYLSK